MASDPEGARSPADYANDDDLREYVLVERWALPAAHTRDDASFPTPILGSMSFEGLGWLQRRVAAVAAAFRPAVPLKGEGARGGDADTVPASQNDSLPPGHELDVECPAAAPARLPGWRARVETVQCDAPGCCEPLCGSSLSPSLPLLIATCMSSLCAWIQGLPATAAASSAAILPALASLQDELSSACEPALFLHHLVVTLCAVLGALPDASQPAAVRACLADLHGLVPCLVARACGCVLLDHVSSDLVAHSPCEDWQAGCPLASRLQAATMLLCRLPPSLCAHWSHSLSPHSPVVHALARHGASGCAMAQQGCEAVVQCAPQLGRLVAPALHARLIAGGLNMPHVARRCAEAVCRCSSELWAYADTHTRWEEGGEGLLPFP